jgi:soluble lytic murein transglycosylase
MPTAALRIATQLANIAPRDAAASLVIQSLIYPTAFLELVDEQARRYNLDPRLLLALVRQESLFDQVAGSTAGALGLTQVIPSTGRDIAAGIGVADFEPNQLFRPATSLHFGADYLAQMLRQFNRDLAPALAAYNAGPGNAARWRQSASVHDHDLYIENIDFTETRRYVPLVLEHYAQYLALYPISDP